VTAQSVKSAMGCTAGFRSPVIMLPQLSLYQPQNNRLQLTQPRAEEIRNLYACVKRYPCGPTGCNGVLLRRSYDSVLYFIFDIHEVSQVIFAITQSTYFRITRLRHCAISVGDSD
jgi:hypothetical protein